MAKLSVNIVALPTEVLERLLLAIPLEDRVRFCSSCKRFWLLGASSHSLWETLQICMAAAGIYSFMEWASRRREQFKRLALTLPNVQQGAEAVNSTISCSAASKIAVWCLFQLKPMARLPLTPALALLPWLKQLQLWDLSGGNSSTVPRQFTQLTSLTRLDLRQATGCIIPDGCLPSSLLSLSITLPSPVLPAAIRVATQLKQLQLEVSHRDGPSPLQCSGLEALSQLTLLGLKYCSLQTLPERLLGLSKLVCLELAENEDLGLHATEALASLSQLPALCELSLSQCRVEELPEEVMAIPLKALNISYNDELIMSTQIWRRFDDHTSMPPGLRGLQSLSVDIVFFSDDTPHLSALTHLHLTCREDMFSPDDYEYRDMFNFLCSFPQLQLLTFDSEVARILGNPASLEGFADFLRARAQVVCRFLEPYVLPRVSACVAWDQVD